MECADAAHGLGGHIIADGGCTCPGDVAKAFAGGADYVMLGGMLAGHDQGGGDIITKIYKTNEVDHEGVVVTEQKQFVQFYGMSSNAANKKHFGGLKEYLTKVREVFVPYRGDVAATVQDLLGGIRSTCTYAGAIRLKHQCVAQHLYVVPNNLMECMLQMINKHVELGKSLLYLDLPNGDPQH